MCSEHGLETRFRRDGSGCCAGYVLRAGSSEAKNVVAEFRQVMSAVDGMTIDSEPAPVSVGGRLGYRI
jgi:hypothetical protein